METRKPKWKDRSAYFEPAAAPPERLCDHPGCEAEGRHRAPKSRSRLSEYHWFCIDHVREYNAGWDYCDGMNEAEIEDAWRHDVTWNRPSWPFGTAGFDPRPWQDRDWHEREQELRAAFARAFGGSRGRRDDERRRQAWESAGGNAEWFDGENFDRAGGARTRALDHALSVLDLDYPVDFATVKARYKALVKEHHPDRHGGSRAAEEKLKAINLAYSTLKASMAS